MKTRINDKDLAYAIFALGRFIEYRLGDGMSEEAIKPFVQSYLNLTARRDCREPLSYDALESQKVIDAPVDQEAIHQWWALWLSGGEKLKVGS